MLTKLLYCSWVLGCIGLNFIPVNIRLKPVTSKQHISPSARKIIEKAEKQLLQDRVRGINKTIQDSEDQVNASRSKLASIITQVDLDRCTDFIEKVRRERFKQVKNRQVRKLHILSSKHNSAQVNNNRDNNNRTILGVNANNIDSNEHRVRHGKDQQRRDYNQDNTNSNSKWVINLSKLQLTQTQRRLLEKGPNFAISSNNIPNLDYITAIETVLLCNVKWLNEQTVIEQKKTVICFVYFPASSHLVYCLRLYRKKITMIAL